MANGPTFNGPDIQGIFTLYYPTEMHRAPNVTMKFKDEKYSWTEIEKTTKKLRFKVSDAQGIAVQTLPVIAQLELDAEL
jgi:hypothetical protein